MPTRRKKSVANNGYALSELKRKKAQARPALTSLTLLPKHYDALHKLVTWYESTPPEVTLDDDTEDRVHELMTSPFDTLLPEDHYVASVQFDAGKRRGEPRILVALVDVMEEGVVQAPAETHVPIRRGPEPKPKRGSAVRVGANYCRRP